MPAPCHFGTQEIGCEKPHFPTKEGTRGYRNQSGSSSFPRLPRLFLRCPPTHTCFFCKVGPSQGMDRTGVSTSPTKWGAWHSALVHFVTSYSPVVRKRDRSVSPSLSWGGESSVNLVPSCALGASGSVSLLPRLALCPSTLTAGAGAVPFWYARDWLREAPLSHQRGDEGLPQPIGLKLVS